MGIVFLKKIKIKKINIRKDIKKRRVSIVYLPKYANKPKPDITLILKQKYMGKSSILLKSSSLNINRYNNIPGAKKIINPIKINLIIAYRDIINS